MSNEQKRALDAAWRALFKQLAAPKERPEPREWR